MLPPQSSPSPGVPSLPSAEDLIIQLARLMYAYLHYFFSLKKHRYPERTPIFYRFRLVPCYLRSDVVAKFSSLDFSLCLSAPCERFFFWAHGRVHPAGPNAPWKDSENATNAPSFRLWVHLGCSLGAGRVHLYQTRSQHFGVDTSKGPITVALDVFVVVADPLFVSIPKGDEAPVIAKLDYLFASRITQFLQAPVYEQKLPAWVQYIFPPMGEHLLVGDILSLYTLIAQDRDDTLSSSRRHG